MRTILRSLVGKTVGARLISLEICAAQCMLLQCGNERISPVAVALLGRFLPRLGPLPQGERPFFLKHASGFLTIRLRPDRAAALRLAFQQAGPPTTRIRAPAWQRMPRAHSGARPCRAPD